VGQAGCDTKEKTDVPPVSVLCTRSIENVRRITGVEDFSPTGYRNVEECVALIAKTAVAERLVRCHIDAKVSGDLKECDTIWGQVLQSIGKLRPGMPAEP
jgi:hypothetical protein